MSYEPVARRAGMIGANIRPGMAIGGFSNPCSKGTRGRPAGRSMVDIQAAAKSFLNARGVAQEPTFGDEFNYATRKGANGAVLPSAISPVNPPSA